MAGSIQYVRGLENRSGRMKLKPGAKVYWRSIVGTLALGYQRRHAGGAGRWISRGYIGNEKYRQIPIAMADDYEQSNGGAILTFEEASEKVRQSHVVWPGSAAQHSHGWTTRSPITWHGSKSTRPLDVRPAGVPRRQILPDSAKSGCQSSPHGN